MPSINFPSEFKDIIIKYNNRDFKNALKLLDKIPENKNFKIFKLQLYASIYFYHKNGKIHLFIITNYFLMKMDLLKSTII